MANLLSRTCILDSHDAQTSSVQKINGCSAKINALSAEQTANADSPQGTQVSQVLERNAEIR